MYFCLMGVLALLTGLNSCGQMGRVNAGIKYKGLYENVVTLNVLVLYNHLLS